MSLAKVAISSITCFLMLASSNAIGREATSVGVGLNQLFLQASDVVSARIVSGELVNHDSLCGAIYLAELVHRFSGKNSQERFSFISWEPFAIGDVYVLFLNWTNPYEVPQGISIEDPSTRTELGNCTQLIRRPIPKFSTGWKARYLKVVDSALNVSEEWLEYDALKIRLPHGLEPQEESSQICIEDESDQVDCSVVGKRLLIRLVDFERFFQSNTEVEDSR